MYIIHYHKNKCLSIPTQWNECKGKQACALAGIIHNSDNDDLKLLKALQVLTGKNKYNFFRLPVEVKHDSLTYIAWVFKENKLTNQLLPKYKKLHGPAKEFDNFKISEFHYCEMIYNRIVKEKDDSLIDLLVAALYREAKPNYDIQKNLLGDCRVAFIDTEVPYRSKKIAKWPKEVKLYVMLWYDGCRQYLQELYKPVFEGNKATIKEYYDGMFGIVREIAGAKYGTIEKVFEEHVHTIMTEMLYAKREANDAKKHNKL